MFVFSNTAVSLDGRVADAAESRSGPGSATDLAYMSVLRARADAVLIGGATFRRWRLPLLPDQAAIDRLGTSSFPDGAAPGLAGRRWWNVVMSRQPSLPDAPRFWEEQRIRPLCVSPPGQGPVHGWLGEQASATDLAAVLDLLAERGVTRLLVEAGPALLLEFLRMGLLDELHVTVCPRLYGRGPSLLDGVVRSGAYQRLKLLHAHLVGDELYTRYAVERP